MYICIDFDGTIVEHQYPLTGQPVPHSIYWMKEWQKIGGNLILFTMRGGPYADLAVEYLKENDIKMFGINTNPTQQSWTDSPKAYGNIYVDDSAFGCPLITPKGFSVPCVDWSIVGPAIHQTLLDQFPDVTHLVKDSTTSKGTLDPISITTTEYHRLLNAELELIEVKRKHANSKTISKNP